MCTRTKAVQRTNAMMCAAMVAVCASGLCGWPAMAAPAPMLHLDFEHGLLPELGPRQEGTWTEKTPPQYDEHGLTGKALLITDAADARVSFPAPAGTQDKGTLLFWSRGLENWDLWGRGNNRHLWWTSNFLGTGGEGGGVWLYKWGWYDNLTYLLMPGGAQGNQALGSWPHFDQYQWTQIGLSWQAESNSTKRLRFYLNGELVTETSGLFPFNSLALWGNVPKGGRRMFDNLKVWDRALPPSEIKRLFRLDAQWANQPTVSVPRLATAPVIDGTIAPQEWAGAARMTGFLDAQTGEMAVDQSAFYLGYDATNLYVAVMGDMTELARSNPAAVIERFLRAERTGRDDTVAAEDAVEIIVSPTYWQAAHRREPGPWQEYRLLLNAAGGYAAAMYDAVGGKPAWDVERKTASTVGPAGWQFEVRIPLAAFGVPAPAPGERWGLQLGRVWKQLKDEHDVWAWGRRDRPEPDKARMYPGEVGGPPVPYQPDPTCRLHYQPASNAPLGSLGVMQFAKDDTPLVRVNQLGALSKNTIDFRATIANPAAAEQKVKVKLGTDTEASLYDETVVLPANGQIEVSKRHPITDYATSRLVFEVMDVAGKLIHRTAVPFFIEQRFGVRVAQLPNVEQFRVQLDLGAMAAVPVDQLRVDLQLLNAKGKTVYAKRDQRVPAYLSILEGETRGIREGTYTLSVAIRRGDAVLAQEQSPFKKAAKAPWYDNRYGCDDMDRDVVPYPWTDMKVRDQKSEVRNQRSEVVSVWGREYWFGKGLLPEQMTTLGAPLLRAPMRLVMKTADGQVLDSSQADARSKWTKRSKTRVEGVRTIKAAAYSVNDTFWAEYDGLVWSTLTVTPKAKMTVASLEIEIPLTPEFSDVIKAGGLRTTGKLKPAGYHSGMETPWIGNGDGGMQIFPSRPWHVKDERQVLHVSMNDGAATIRLVLIDVPTELDGPRDFTLGLVATPLRPKIWRTPEYTSYRVPVGQGGGGAWFPPGYEFVPAADMGRSYRGEGEILYAWTASLNIRPDAAGTDDFALYGAEWMDDVFQRPSENMIYPTVAAKSFRDYFAGRYWRYQQKYGYRGLYYDNPGGPLLDVREIMKRLYNITISNPKFGARDTDIGLASNGAYDMVFGGFATYQWNGENLNSVVGPNDTYRGILDPDVFRAEYMGHNWGWPARLLGQGRVRRAAIEAAGGPEAVQDHVDGLVLLHDTAIPAMMPCCIVHDGGPINQVAKRLYDAIARHKFYHWAYQFVPYWQQQIVTLPREKMYASLYIAKPSTLTVEKPDLAAYFPMYRHLPPSIQLRIQQEVAKARDELAGMKDKAILIVYNDSDWAGVMRLKPDWKMIGLGLPAGLTATNAVHSTGFRVEKTGEKDKDGKVIEKAVFFPRPEETANIENGELVFPMTKFNYRMIVIEKAQ